MDINNAKSQMRKGMLEYCILLLLKRAPAYASDIIRQLQEAELLVVEGPLYPLLTRLKKALLPVAGEHPGPAPQVLRPDPGGRGVPRGPRPGLERTGPHRELPEEMNMTRKEIRKN